MIDTPRDGSSKGSVIESPPPSALDDEALRDFYVWFV